MMKQHWLTVCVMVCASPCWAAPFVFNDIQHWVGAGSQRAALVIDWDGAAATDQAAVWGYRWDGTATGKDMLLAVAADPTARLFVRVGTPSAFGVPLYGLGYDRNGNGQFGISDGTTFVNGVAVTGVPDASGASTATDPGDAYREGWYTGFWHYVTGNGNPFDGGAWVEDPTGMSGRTLTNNAWDGYAFDADFSSFSAFTDLPANPVAAVPEPAGPTLVLAAVLFAGWLLWRRARADAQAVAAAPQTK